MCSADLAIFTHIIDNRQCEYWVGSAGVDVRWSS